MITIPNPCPEKWENMLPVVDGSFCGKCSQTVFDFSNSSDEEIIDFLSSKSGDRVCGKIRTRKITRRKSFLSKFLSAVAIAFTPMIFASCHSDGEGYAVGDVAYKTDSVQIQQLHDDSLNAVENAIEKQKDAEQHRSDSTKAADSVKRTKNPIRDFN
jgi:hypothetical protein